MKMKKTSRRIILANTAVACTLLAAAQQDFVRIYPDSEVNCAEFSDSEKFIHPSSPSQDTGSMIMKASQAKVSLKCNLKGNDSYTPFRYLVYNADVCHTKNPGDKFNIEKGKYDICAEFYTGEYTQPYFARVIRENVEIDADMTLDLDVEEAKNVIEMFTAKADGTRLLLPNKADAEAEYDAERMMLYTMAAHEDYKYFTFGVGEAAFSTPTGSAELAFGMRVNDVSDKYHFMQARLIRLKDGGVMYHCPVAHGASDAEDGLMIINSGESVKEVVEEYELTPLSREYRRLQDNFASLGLSLFNGKDLGGFSATFGGDVCKILVVDNTIDDPNPIFQPMVVTGALDIQDVVLSFDDNGNITGQDNIQTGVYGCPIVFENGNMINVNPNNTSLENSSILYPANSYLHGHDSFSFASESKSEKYSCNTPLTVATIRDNKLTTGESTLQFTLYSIGRWGETRRSDMYRLSGNIADADGNILFEGTHHGFNDAINKAISNGTSKFKLTTVNKNIEIDGSAVQSSMLTEWDMTREDFIPPVITMLQTKDQSGNICQRFDSAYDGVIEFTAADFKWDDRINGFADASEIDVELEMAPENGDFIPVATTEIPELYHMPAFGHFYRASLSHLTNVGWHTVKITVKDAAGNSQTQTLERAFYVNKPGEIQNISNEGPLTLNGNTIATSEPTHIRIYDIKGLTLFDDTIDGELDLSGSLVKGIYIVRNESDGTTLKLTIN